ncbi:hypothetical protein [Gordonia rubripertincta]|uniref:hypothetical protein n=1 Tax=Gordonia rubripertincta TaxID=36822 RepID=UPI0015FB9CA3|nr:hypothetical protein [Gordonia rubripertincta]QMU22126.1 hypothetical protein H3V45_06465 [Gordonia rubripertincta]
MSDKVSVDLVELRYGGHQLSGWHVESSDTFGVGFRRVAEAAETGWVGASAKALSEKLDALQASARAVTIRLGENASGFVHAASTYGVQDAAAGATLVPEKTPEPPLASAQDDHPPLNL